MDRDRFGPGIAAARFAPRGEVGVGVASSGPVPPGDESVELTCTREVCHVVLTVPVRDVPLVLGTSCPHCHLGVLERRERLAPDGCED
jgi:hypothetical protein